jgi:hypothetical protein
MTTTTSSRTGKYRSGRRLTGSLVAARPADPDALSGWAEAAAATSRRVDSPTGDAGAGAGAGAGGVVTGGVVTRGVVTRGVVTRGVVTGGGVTGGAAVSAGADQDARVTTGSSARDGAVGIRRSAEAAGAGLDQKSVRFSDDRST